VAQCNPIALRFDHWRTPQIFLIPFARERQRLSLGSFSCHNSFSLAYPLATMQIVFVHLQTPLPRHLTLNLERTARLFPKHTVWLITDQVSKRLKNSPYSIYEPVKGTSWAAIESTLSHPKDFRGNFWFTSLARFLALGEFSEEHEGEILHVESDVVLSKDFPFEIFSSLSKSIYFPVVSEHQAIASTLYFRNSAGATALARFSVESALKLNATTDMLVLHGLLEERSDLCGVLPSGPPVRQVFSSNLSDNLFQEMAEGYPKFGGVFDGWEYGAFLFGHDPRNGRGWSPIRTDYPEYYIHVDQTRYVFDQVREFPNLVLEPEGLVFPLYSMHIHAKILGVFHFRNSSRTIRKYVSKSHLPSRRIFSPIIFLKAIPPALERRSKRFWALVR